MLLGVFIGLERTRANKMAGMRTYALVSMGAALFVVISEEVVKKYLGFGNIIDPLRMVSQIVVGVGFIGTGIIMSKDSKLTGLTTATGLWVSAAIGMAAGFGLFKIAIFSTFLILFIFVVLWYLENKLKSLKWFKEGNEDNKL